MYSSSNGANSSDLQQMNRVLVLSLLRKYRTTTRAELARMTGLKRATITNIINEFLACHIVKELGATEGEKGRRSIQIALDPGDRRVVAIRLARKYFTVGVFDILGNLYEKHTVSLDFQEGAVCALKRIQDALQQLFDCIPHIFVIGIALPGPYLKNQDRIVQISDFPGWEGVSIVEYLQNIFHVPVYAEHDSNASALTEWWYGDHICGDDQVLLNILAGQGVGAGLVHDGVIYHGSHGFSGELGHTSIAFDGEKCACGNRGCLDLYCSSIVLIRNIRAKCRAYPDSILNGQEITLERIAEAVKQGDALAVAEIRSMGQFLACGIVNAVNLWDPDIVVIGDELAEVGGDCLLEAVKKSLMERLPPSIWERLEVKLSKLENPMLSGAMCVAVDSVFKNLQIL